MFELHPRLFDAPIGRQHHPSSLWWLGGFLVARAGSSLVLRAGFFPIIVKSRKKSKFAHAGFEVSSVPPKLFRLGTVFAIIIDPQRTEGRFASR